MKPNELRLYPIAPRTRGYLAHSDHPFRAAFTVGLCVKAAEGGEEEEVNKELELPHLPDMLFIHNRLRCSHASGFQIEVQHFLKDFFCLRGRFPSLP